MIQFEVIDDFLPTHLVDKMEDLFSKDLPWFFSDRTVIFSDLMEGNFGNTLIKETYQFNHNILINDRYMTSPEIAESSLQILAHLEKYLNRSISKIGRIKANLTLQNNWTTDNYHPPHVDTTEDDVFTLVYYINDSDGDFRIFDRTVKNRFETKEQVLESYQGINCLASISPKKGRAVMLPSNTLHSGSCPIQSKTRMMINFVFGFFPVDKQPQ